MHKTKSQTDNHHQFDKFMEAVMVNKIKIPPVQLHHIEKPGLLIKELKILKSISRRLKWCRTMLAIIRIINWVKKASKIMNYKSLLETLHHKIIASKDWIIKHQIIQTLTWEQLILR